MVITATEFKTNLGKYLDIAKDEDICITKNGNIIAKLVNPFQERRKIAESLFGVVKNSNFTLEDAKKERAKNI